MIVGDFTHEALLSPCCVMITPLQYVQAKFMFHQGPKYSPELSKRRQETRQAHSL